MHSNFSVQINGCQVPDEKPYFANHPDRHDPRTFIKKPKLITYCQGLSRAAKELYEILTDYGRNGPIFPSITTLAADMGLSERQIARLVAELRAAKLIVTRRTGRSNIYYLLELTPRLIEPSSQRTRGKQAEQLVGEEQAQPAAPAQAQVTWWNEADTVSTRRHGQHQAARSAATPYTTPNRAPGEEQPQYPVNSNMDRAAIFGTSDLTKMADKRESLNHVCDSTNSANSEHKQGGISLDTSSFSDQQVSPAQAERRRHTSKGYVALLKMGFSQETARRLVETVERNRPPTQAENYIMGWIEYAQAHARTNPAGYVKTVLADNAELPLPKHSTRSYKPARRTRGGHTPVNLVKCSKYMAQANSDPARRFREFEAQITAEAEIELPPASPNTEQPSTPTIDGPETATPGQKLLYQGLRYSLAEFDRRAADRLRGLELKGDTIKASFVGGGEIELEKWLPQVQIYYPQAIRVEVETRPGRW